MHSQRQHQTSSSPSQPPSYAEACHDVYAAAVASYASVPSARTPASSSLPFVQEQQQQQQACDTSAAAVHAPVGAADDAAHRQMSSSSSMSSSLSSPTDVWHMSSHSGGGCACAMCQLGAYVLYLFAGQRRASLHAMLTMPSPYLAHGAASLPSLPPLPRPPGIVGDACPVYARYGFCPYAAGCYLRHGGSGSGSCPLPPPPPPPRVPPAADADAELQRLRDKAAAHLDTPLWSCDVCGYDAIDERCIEAVGELYYYRHCPRCSLMCYFPHVTYLVMHLLHAAGDDYQRYKDNVDHYRARVPDEYKVPLTFEAHRIASVVFAWSLLAPRDAKAAIEAAQRVVPDLRAIVSIGSGTGYVEHVFNRVLHTDVRLRPEWQPARAANATTMTTATATASSSSSFDGAHAELDGACDIAIYAFDELALRRTYSVHVSLGGPLSLLSMHCAHTVLLLCWPPFGSAHEEQSSMAYEALEYFTQCGGRVLIYVGDVASTGDWRFHQRLYTHYQLVRDYPVRRELRRWLPQQMGLVYAGNDTIGVYRRRDTPVPLPAVWNCSM